MSPSDQRPKVNIKKLDFNKRVNYVRKEPFLFLGSLSELLSITKVDYEINSKEFVRTGQYSLNDVDDGMKKLLVNADYDGVIYYQIVPCLNPLSLLRYIAQGLPVKEKKVSDS